MAHTLRFSYGGSQINFNSGSITLRHYVPESPNMSTMDSNSILMDGGRRTMTSRRNVAENCTVLIKSPNGSASNVTQAKQKIQNWLLSAEIYHETDSGSPVYVEYAPDGLSGSVYRSKLFGGKVDVVDDSLDTRWTQNRAVELGVTWLREYFWEGGELTVTLENSGCTSTCSTVWNQNPLDYTGQSGCYNNWVQISGSNLVGEMESPATIEIHNQSGTMSSVRFHLFHGWGKYITSLPTTIEGEDTIITQGGSTRTSACSSGGAWFEMPFTNNITWQKRWEFPLPSGSLQKFNGEYYNVVMGFHYPTINDWEIFLKPRLYDAQGWSGCALQQITEGPAKEIYRPSGYTADAVMPLGVIQIPPGILSETSTIEHEYLTIVYTQYSTTSSTLGLDCIHIMPANGYRYIDLRGSLGFTTSDYITDYGSENKVLWVDQSRGATWPNMRWRGNPIMLQPQKDQRIYMLAGEQDGGSSDGAYDAFRKFGLKIKYRPRRLTI